MKNLEMGLADKNKTSKLSEQLQQYIHAIQFFDDCTTDYIYIYDLTAARVFLTDKFREKFPIPPAQEDGNDFADWDNIVYPKDRHLMDYYRELLFKGEIDSFDINYRILNRQGDKVWVRVTGALREKDDTQALLLVGHISEIASGGIVDNLTGLYGNQQFMEDIKESLRRESGYLMILGVDNFQNINLTQGRAFGDTVLQAVAEQLDTRTKYPMGLYRLAGDCFAVVFVQQSQREAEGFYAQIKKSLHNVCTLSAGVVKFHCDDGIDSETIYLYAETALQQAKKEGKNKLVFFSADKYQKNLEQVALLTEMKECIAQGCKGFYLEYQPQINGQDFTVHGVEALVRYDSPTKGRISPVDFISLLEQTGLICQVGEWVLKTAVLQCKQWRKHLPHLHMSVNMSYIQLQQNGITDTVLDVLEQANLPGEALTLELTESIQLQNYNYFNKIFYAWKEHGIGISIDDFGTGYSSLGYLKSIEIDEVKIDRCFVSHVQHNAYNFRLLRNMIELAHSAEIQVCCEGVETLEEVMALQELHTDVLQGYFFAKPCSVDLFEEIYIRHKSEAYQSRKEKEQNLQKLEANESKKLLEELRNEEISNITENMDEMVYVSDTETYELYYLNAAGRRMTGVYDYKGCKCYKVLQGKDAPCEFCTNSKLSKDKFLIWEIENTFLNMHFILKDKLIPWKGKMARAEIAIDITEKEFVSQSIRKKLHFERAIVDCCKIIAHESGTERSMGQVLKIIGEVCQSDHAYILRNSGGDNLWNLEWEWNAQGKESIKKHFPVELKQFDVVTANRIIVPIIHKNRRLGAIGLENPHYTQDVKDLLETISYFVGYVLAKE